MSSLIIKIKTNGSGSAIPIVKPSEKNKNWVNGLLKSSITSIDDAKRYNIPLFSVNKIDMSVSVLLPTGEIQSLDDYSLTIGISENEKNEIYNNVINLYPEDNELVFCHPRIAINTVLHNKSYPYNLKINSKNHLILYVDKFWNKLMNVKPVTLPSVSGKMLYKDGIVKSYNKAEKFITRPYMSGSDQFGNILANVEKNPDTVSPWPIDNLGFGLISVFDLLSDDFENYTPKTFYAWLGDCNNSINFYGDGTTTAKTYGFTNGLPYLIEHNINPDNPKLWFNNWVVDTFLDPPKYGTTGAYRPGLYYDNDNSLIMINLSYTQGNISTDLYNNYPVYKSDYPFSIYSPDITGSSIYYKGKINNTPIIANYLSTDYLTVNPVSYFEEYASWSDTGEFLELEISITTGGPDPCNKNMLDSTIRIYTNNIMFNVIPVENEPIPEVSMIENGWMSIHIPLDGLLIESGTDFWEANQSKTFKYKFSTYSSPGIIIYPLAVFGPNDSLNKPSELFIKFLPFPLQ